MQNRQDKILNLLSEDTWLTGKELSKLLSVSDRTIRNDIKKINELENKDIIISSKKYGYRLNEDFLNNSYIKNTNDLEKRKSSILMYLLRSKDNASYSDLLENLYISDASLNSCITEINNYISKFNNISIKRDKDKLYFDGSEQSIRLLYKDLLFKETKENLFNLDEITKLYKNFNLSYYKAKLEDIFKKYNYEIDEVSYPLLILHIGVMLDRILSNKALKTLNIDYEDLDKTIEYKISTDFFNIVKKSFSEEISNPEITLLALNIMNKKSVYKNTIAKNDNIRNIIKKLLLHLVENTKINLTKDEDLINSLYLHIKALISRLKDNQDINNLYLPEIKKKYPYIFEIAVVATRFLEKELNITIKEDEIGFIALHLGNAYKKLYNVKYKTIVILPKTRAVSNNMFEQINTIFSQELEILGIYTYFEESLIKDKSVDLIISSMPLYHNLAIKTVYCSIFFTKDDEINIFKAIRELEQNRLEKNYTKHLKNLLDKNHFHIKKSFDTKNDLLQYLCNDLYEKNEVTNLYFSKVLEREQYSGTSFSQGFAIPHSIRPSEIKKSSISVLILEDPIQWDEYKVNIVLLLTIARSDMPVLKLFFSWMDKLCSDMKVFSNIIKSKSYEEFIKNFEPKN